MNNFIVLITLNYIKNFFKKKDNTIPAVISILSIAISVFSLIMVLSVMKGFEVKVKNKILASFPHIIISTGDSINLDKIKNIKSFNKTSEDYGAFLENDNFNVLQIKGFDYLESDQLHLATRKGNKYPVVISKDFSRKYSLSEGSNIKIIAPDFSSKKPKIKKINLYVSNINNLPSNNIDRIYIKNSFKSELGLTRGAFHEVYLKNPYESKRIIEIIIDKYPELKFKTVDWQTLNKSFFSLMELERLSIGIFLMFLIILSATNIYSNIVSFISEKKTEIGSLVLLGASKNNLIIIFTLVGLSLGVVGTLIGVIMSGLLTYLIIEKQIIDSLAIDITFYQIEGFPILFSAEYFVLISLLSILAVLISSFIPSFLILNKNLESLIRRDF